MQLALDVFQVRFQVVDLCQVQQAAFGGAVALGQTQVAGLDLFVFAQGVSPFEHVLQFPHIAWKAVAFQRVEGLRVEFCRRLPGVGGQAHEHVAGQRFYVVAALAQGRNPQLDHIQAVVQVLAKAFSGDFGIEVFVGGAKDAHIDHLFLLPADAAYGFLLNRA